VVSIIALLIAILLPSLKKARDQAKTVACEARLRGLQIGMITYTSEFYVFPPSLSNYAAGGKGLQWQAGRDWLGIGDQSSSPFAEGVENDPTTGNPKGFASAPTRGLLFRMTKSAELYRCPTDNKKGVIDANDPMNSSTNGKFSFTSFDMLGVRPIERIPSRFADSTGGGRNGSGSSPTKRLSARPLSKVPIFVEEHPFGIGGYTSGHTEGNFNFALDIATGRHGPYRVREGHRNGSTDVTSFLQGNTDIAFGDGHVESIALNFGYQMVDIQPTSVQGGKGRKGIPYTAAGLLYYYGVDFTTTTAVLPITIEK
jgi:prepilin-type processing-associated H-X9-DG protein